MNTVLRYKWSQPEAPEGQQVPVDAVNKFWHATFVDPKNYRDGGAPNADTLYSPAWLYAKEQPIIITVPEIPGNRYFAIELAGFDSDNLLISASACTAMVAETTPSCRRIGRETYLKMCSL